MTNRLIEHISWVEPLTEDERWDIFIDIMTTIFEEKHATRAPEGFASYSFEEIDSFFASDILPKLDEEKKKKFEDSPFDSQSRYQKMFATIPTENRALYNGLYEMLLESWSPRLRVSLADHFFAPPFHPNYKALTNTCYIRLQGQDIEWMTGDVCAEVAHAYWFEHNPLQSYTLWSWWLAKSFRFRWGWDELQAASFDAYQSQYHERWSHEHETHEMVEPYLHSAHVLRPLTTHVKHATNTVAK